MCRTRSLVTGWILGSALQWRASSIIKGIFWVCTLLALPLLITPINDSMNSWINFPNSKGTGAVAPYCSPSFNKDDSMMDDPDDKKPENWVEEKRIVDEKAALLSTYRKVHTQMVHSCSVIYDIYAYSNHVYLCCAPCLHIYMSIDTDYGWCKITNHIGT